MTIAHTLTSGDYCSPEVFEAEKRQYFHGGWFMALRADTLRPGNRRVVEIAGESVLLARDLRNVIHAHANVCRHRGARLCEEDSSSTQGSLMCPYHAWTYALDGTLIATPHLDNDEVDKSQLSLWRIAVEVWQGFVFVCLSATPPDFAAWMALHCAELTALERYCFGDLEVAVTTRSDVAANWKILVENYQECLHCTRVHPELVEIIPTYRSGWVWDRGRPDGGVTLKNRGNSFTLSGTSQLPILPGLSELDATTYFGCTAYPNMFVDVTGTSAIVTTMFPVGPALTRVVTEYMFAPETIASAEFDPAPVVEFSELVAAQDYAVCERVQRGVSSKFFTAGVLTTKDDLVIAMTQHYLDTREGH